MCPVMVKIKVEVVAMAVFPEDDMGSIKGRLLRRRWLHRPGRRAVEGNADRKEAGGFLFQVVS